MLDDDRPNMYIAPMPLEAMRHRTAGQWGKTLSKCEKRTDWKLQQLIDCEHQF